MSNRNPRGNDRPDQILALDRIGRRGFVKAAGLATITGASVVVLAGCTGQEPKTTQPTGSGTSEAPATDPGQEPTSRDWYNNVPTDVAWDETAKVEAEKALRAGFGAFTDVSGGQTAWWGRYGPLLAPAYQQEAFYIDVERITVRKATSFELVNDSSNPITAWGKFTTDAGTWWMGINRTGAGAPWLITNFSTTDPWGGTNG